MLGASGSLLAAENLSPLRVDPELLNHPIPAKALTKATPGSSSIGTPRADAMTSPSSPPSAPLPRQPSSAENPVTVLSKAKEPDGTPPSQTEQFLPTIDLSLKFSRQMTPLTRGSKDNELHPTFVAADRIHGQNDVETVAEGNVELRKIGTVLTTDRLTYREENDEVEAIGNVHLLQNEDIITGPRMRLRVEDNIGYFDEPNYIIKRTVKDAAPGQRTTGYGQAQRINFEGEDHYRLTDATYSTCGPGIPGWYAHTGEMKLDYEKSEGEANDATLVFQNVPILYSPWLSFSLDNHRKSGLLSPTFGTTSKSGIEITQPYYINIAPNMDATISPRFMMKRGVEWNGEFRYLEQNYNGVVQGELLPNDLLTHSRRSSYSLQHNQNFGLGFSGNLSLNGVSDDSYFTDLSTRMSNIAQNNLLRQGVFSYASTWWNASAMAQSFQTLQDPALPTVAVPYRRLPQLTLNATRADLPLGGVFAFNSEYVNFAHPSQTEGTRATLYPQLSLPLQTTAFYLTPKLGLHSTSYNLDHQGTGIPDKISRSVPIFSIDSGVTFERPVETFGREQTQTLEPRLYYLKVPTRDQSQIPAFDTGIADFNYAQIFSDNRYSGGDRIGDANQLTAAVVSRLLDRESGAELLRGSIGQRYYFKNQEVTLPGETARTNNMADFLATLGGQVIPKVSFDTAVQYNLHENQFNKITLSGRYQPEYAHVLSASYRYNRDQVTLINNDRQIDLSGQWPLWGGWSGVGRYNYSLADHRIIESVGGLEYNGGCWVSRVVLQRIATATGDSSTAFFIQLELNGFSNIGSNPMDMLKRNIPGYGRINQPAADPVFATN